MHWRKARNYHRGSIEQLESRRLLASNTKPDTSERQEIVGGVESERGAFGFAVSLQDNGQHFCGGTLIAPETVLTAAHCVEGVSISRISAVVGREHLSTSDGQRAGISQIIVHPDYDAESLDSDIAILILQDTVVELPIGYLTDANEGLASPGEIATVIGWGTTREGGFAVDNVREAQVPIVSNAVANLPQSYGGDITDHMLAAGFAAGGVDSCQGDSGGPMIVSDAEGNPQLAGIVSWGEGCGRANKYGIYTRVAEFAPWIDEQIGINSTGEVNFSQPRYVADNEATIVIRDGNADSSQPITVVVESASGDVENVVLRPFATGGFRGTIGIAAADPTVQNELLEVSGEEEITVTYVDEDDGSGEQLTHSNVALVVMDDFPNGPSSARTIETDSEIEAEIEVNADVDWFQFEAVAGQGYEVAVELDSLNDSVVTLYAADGERVLAFDDDSGRQLGSKVTYFPSQSGMIFIETGGYAAANIGTYTLTLTETDTPSDDHSDFIGNATFLDTATREGGVVDTQEDADWFEFAVENGRTYQIDVVVRTLTDSELRLFDENGVELAHNDDVGARNRGSRIYYRATEDGTKFLEVTGFSDATGSYDIVVQTADDDHGNDATTATGLGAIGTTSSAEFGSISPQDVDWFSFEVEENQFYELRTFFTGPGNTSTFDTIITLFDEAGDRSLAENDDHLEQLSSRIVWQASTSGLHHVQVAGFGDSEAQYRINVRELSSPPVDDYGNRSDLAADIEMGESISGNVNYESDVDWLRFDAIEGLQYTFEVALQSLTDSVLQLYDSDGTTLLLENDDIEFPDRSSLLNWTADASGTRYLRVSGFDGFRGTYRLNTSFDFAIGDFNEDQSVDATDIDLLFETLSEGRTDTLFDVNGDGVVNTNDTDHLLGAIGTLPGDTDLDGKVEFDDFLKLARSFGAEGGWADGNFSADPLVDFQDFLALARNFGESAA